MHSRICSRAAVYEFLTFLNHWRLGGVTSLRGGARVKFSRWQRQDWWGHTLSALLRAGEPWSPNAVLHWAEITKNHRSHVLYLTNPLLSAQLVIPLYLCTDLHWCSVAVKYLSSLWFVIIQLEIITHGTEKWRNWDKMCAMPPLCWCCQVRINLKLKFLFKMNAGTRPFKSVIVSFDACSIPLNLTAILLSVLWFCPAFIVKHDGKRNQWNRFYPNSFCCKNKQNIFWNLSALEVV